MKIAIFESIVTPGGHEIEFDRIIIDGLRELGHDVTFYVPQDYVFKYDYGVAVRYLPGKGVSYAGASGLGKIWRSAKREINRQRWYNALYQQAVEGAFDAVIVPTATYRYLRALNFSKLKKSPVPVIFIILGVTPEEGNHLFPQVEKLYSYPNIKVAVQTFRDNVLGRTFPNLYCVKPPAYIPHGITLKPIAKPVKVLRIGSFGQYRKEKNLDVFLDAFLSCSFSLDVSLKIQGAAFRQEDEEDFKRIRQKYQKYPQITFDNRALDSNEWQQAIAGVDVLVMPYAAPRYRYHGSGMLLTALGFCKPVILTDDISPELLEQYEVGVNFPAGDIAGLKISLEKLVNTFNEKVEKYERELQRANDDFAPRRLAQRLIELAANTSKKK